MYLNGTLQFPSYKSSDFIYVYLLEILHLDFILDKISYCHFIFKLLTKLMKVIDYFIL